MDSTGPMNFWGLLMIAVGLFPLCGAAFDWDFYMDSRKSRAVVAIIGRTGARIFYALLGLALVIGGVLNILGVVGNAS